MNIELLNEQMRKAFHAKGYKGDGIIFVPLDTGVDQDIEELCYSQNGLQTSKVIASPMGTGDDTGHGTFVTGQLVSNTYGWCPDARVISYKVLPGGSGNTYQIMDALKDVLARAKSDPDHKYMVNMSLSGTHNPNADVIKEYQKTIDDLVAFNVSVFVAAGNDGSNTLNRYPSCFYSPITVAALNEDATKAYFSTWHNEVDFGEHGVSVLGISCKLTAKNIFGIPSNTTRLSGTSMACPNLLGKSGLLQSEYHTHTGKWLTDDELFDKLKSLALDIDNKGFDPFTGYGYVQIKESEYEKPIPPENPIEEPKYVLQKGDKGDKVGQLQNKLLALGYKLPKFGVDEDFGEETELAIKAFQRDKGLEPNGKVDQITWDALFAEEVPTPPPVEPKGDSVYDFIRWSLTHVKKETIPAGAELLLPIEQCGIDPWEYLYGTTARKATQSLLDEKYNDPYKGWGWSQKEYDDATKGWVERGVTVCDCQGKADAYCTKMLGVKTDINAQGNYNNWCTSRTSDMKTRPYTMGEAVFVASKRSNGTIRLDDINHVGWVCGFLNNEPLILEERGLSYGCVVSRLSKRNFNLRGLMTKRFKYEEDEIPAPEPPTPPTPDPDPIRDLYLTDPIMKGDDVKAFQEKLIALGYDLGGAGADGKFGKLTSLAVKLFQTRAKQITENGKVDNAVRSLLNL